MAARRLPTSTCAARIKASSASWARCSAGFQWPTITSCKKPERSPRFSSPMKNLLRFALFTFAAAALVAADFRDHLGLQLYSLRAQTKESTTGALDIAKGYGIKEV